MYQSLSVSVEDEDLAKGDIKTTNACPLALAIKRRLKDWGKIEIEVSNSEVRINRRNDYCYIYSLPTEAVVFIHNMIDRPETKQEPFGFTMRLYTRY